MTADEPLSPAPEVVRDLAESCVRFVTAALEMPLDYTQDTLPLLDHYLRTAADAEDEILGLVVPAAGAYFGEVLRRHLGAGHWETKGAEYETWRLVIHPGPLTTNPMGISFECASGAPARGWGAEIKMPDEHREAVESAIDNMGDVREEDYYTLAVRFEVLELIHARLGQLVRSSAN